MKRKMILTFISISLLSLIFAVSASANLHYGKITDKPASVTFIAFFADDDIILTEDAVGSNYYDNGTWIFETDTLGKSLNIGDEGQIWLYGSNGTCYNDSDTFSGIPVNWGDIPASESAIAPPSLSATLVSPGIIRLNWTAASGATKYTIYRTEHDNNVYDRIAEVTTETTYDDTGLEHQAYYYIVIGKDDSNNFGGHSNKVSVGAAGKTGEFDIKLFAGAEKNLISLPLTPSEPYTSYSLIEDISNCTEIIRFNADTQKWESTSLSNGEISGPDFPIVEGEGYSVKVSSDTVYTFTGDVITTLITLNLKRGKNLIGIPYSAKPYTSYTLISAIPNCTHVIRYNVNTLSSEATSRGRQNRISGPDFEIKAGEGYYVRVTRNTSWTPGSPAAPMIVPAQTELSPNYPNPFNPETWIPFQLAKDSEVNIRIYNVTGQLIKTIQLGYKQAGMYIEKSKAAHWDGRNDMGEKSASGVYFYELRTEKFRTIGKMVLLK